MFTGTESYDCYYKLLEGSKAPMVSEIKDCTSTSNCGKFLLIQPGASISNKVYPLWKMGLEYSIFFVCYNRVPNAFKASNIVNAFTFIPSCPAGISILNGVCLTTPVSDAYSGNKNPLSTNSLRLNLSVVWLWFVWFCILIIW